MHTSHGAEPPTSVAGRGRGIGLVQGVALYVAAVLGSGLLVLPGLAADVAGPASIVAVVVVIVLAVPLAGTFAALAARFPDPGGVASYVRRALGPTAARATGYWFSFGVSAGFPVLAILGAEYICAIFGVDRAAVPWLAFGILIPPFAVNMLAAARPGAGPARFEPFLPHGWAGVGTAVSLFVWAFAGWEVGTHISGEFRDPRRIIPIATTIALIVTGAAYLLLQVVTVGVLGARAGEGPVPLLTLAARTSPGIGPIAVGVVAGIVALGVMNAYLAAFGKLGASLASTGDLPRFFRRGVEAGGIPRRALLLTFVVAVAYLGVALITGGHLETFILIHTSNMVSIYAAGMVAAVLILPRRTVGRAMAVVAAVLSLGLLVLAGANLIPAALLAAAAIGVTVWRRIRPSARRV